MRNFTSMMYSEKKVTARGSFDYFLDSAVQNLEKKMKNWKGENVMVESLNKTCHYILFTGT